MQHIISLSFSFLRPGSEETPVSSKNCQTFPGGEGRRKKSPRGLQGASRWLQMPTQKWSEVCLQVPSQTSLWHMKLSVVIHAPQRLGLRKRRVSKWLRRTTCWQVMPQMFIKAFPNPASWGTLIRKTRTGWLTPPFNTAVELFSRSRHLELANHQPPGLVRWGGFQAGKQLGAFSAISPGGCQAAGGWQIFLRKWLGKIFFSCLPQNWPACWTPVPRDFTRRQCFGGLCVKGWGNHRDRWRH